MELKGLRIAFLGTPRFAVPSLEGLIAAGHDVTAVYTQPDRPSGRGQRLAFPPVKQKALEHGIPVFQPERIRRPAAIEELTALAPELMVVVGYGQIIPQAILDIPPRDILNVHASILPKYRGAAPIQWAIANGETRTGVTIMRIDAGLDTGDILATEETDIGPEETAPELSERLAELGAGLLARTVSRLDTIAPRPQNPAEATYAPVLKKEDGVIDWGRPAAEIDARMRGFQPWPGAVTTFRGQRLHLFRAKPVYDRRLGAPGSLRVADRSLLVACGSDSALELQEVQLEGRKRVSAEAFRNGQRLIDEERLGEQQN